MHTGDDEMEMICSVVVVAQWCLLPAVCRGVGLVVGLGEVSLSFAPYTGDR